MEEEILGEGNVARKSPPVPETDSEAPVMEFTDNENKLVPEHIARDIQSKSYTAPWLRGHSLHPAVTYAPAEPTTQDAVASGRPRVILPDDLLFEAALTMAGWDTLGKIFGIDGNTLYMNKHYREIVEKARELRKVDLLAAQFHNAVKLNNPIMQIWLGKQYLGQQDKIVQEQTGADGKPIQHEHTVKAVAYVPDNRRDLPNVQAKLLPPAVVSKLDEDGELKEKEPVNEEPSKLKRA